MKKIAIFISGRGSNMEAIAREAQTGILQGVAEVVLVFSNNADAVGLQIAHQLGIPTLCIPSDGKKRLAFDNDVITALRNYVIDYIVLAGYMRVLSPAFIQAFPNRIVNIHPADTRQHQGLHAYEWAWQNRLERTFITVHYVNEGVDTGDILAQYPVDLAGCQTLEEVEKRGLAVEHRAYSETLAKLLA